MLGILALGGETYFMIRVLFLCLGNICRSPMAEAILRNMVGEKDLSRDVHIDSAGVGGWHRGQRPHPGTLEVLDRHKISSEGLAARQVAKEDLDTFDFIVAMDEENVQGLERLGSFRDGQVFRLLDLVPEATEKNVPDPYYTGNFDLVYDLIRLGCERLLHKIEDRLAESST
jgi:protein-tyrosine phosphatase